MENSGAASSPPMRCGYAVLLGCPNSGKSTLLNALVGQKLAIVSPKPQTTRSRVLGIVIEGTAQILFLDTPGIFAAKKPLEKAMVKAAWHGVEDADVILLLVDATKKQPDASTEIILQHLKQHETKKPVWLIINKIDAATNKERLLPLTAAMHAAYPFAETFMICAKEGDGVDVIRRKLETAMPEGHWLYDADQVTDMPQRLLAAEITREQLYVQLEQELPYSATVETENWESFDNGDAKISQIIVVERDGQKAIIIGHKGEKLKAIGAAARAEMAQAFDCKVHLFLTVQVKEDWQSKSEFYESRGLTLKE